MLDALVDARLQVTAGASLLEASRLVEWNSPAREFRAVSHEAFEFSWRRDFDPVFGRLACWILFSAGAECLAKGVCLSKQIDFREDMPVPTYPATAIAQWASKFIQDKNAFGTLTTTDFGTLGGLTYEGKKRSVSYLRRLCDSVGASNNERELLLAGYRLLTDTIRNRDAHAYVPNVRDSHHWLVEELFVKCFTLLIAWLPGGPTRFEKWRSEAAAFVDSM